MPEITLKDSFGKAIQKTIRKYNIRTVLEIGAFNGDGSTLIIASELERKGSASISLTSIEYDTERFEELVRNTKKYEFVNAINKSSIGNNAFTARNFEVDVWSSPYNGLKNKFSREDVARWHSKDLKELERNETGFLENSTYEWDAVLIDGGEFSGYDEYRLIKDRTKCIMLDDSFHAYKTFRARVELSSDPGWILEWQDWSIRNGAAIFVKRELGMESTLSRIECYLRSWF